MQVEVKKTIAVFVIYFFLFCIGIDHGLVIPSIYKLLESRGIGIEAILGVAISGYSLCNCVSSRALKHLFDGSHSSRLLLGTCCASYVTGGFFYTYGASWWGVTLGRCCSGLGSGAAAVITADIAYSSMGDDHQYLQWRSRAALILGWLTAPLLSIVLAVAPLADIRTTPEVIPGVLCACLFALCGLLVLAGFMDLGRYIRFCRLRQSLRLAYERNSISSRKSYGAIPMSSALVSSDVDYEYSEEREPETVRIITGLRLSLEEEDVAPCIVQSSGRDLLCRRDSGLTNSNEILENAEDMMGCRSSIPDLLPHHVSASAPPSPTRTPTVDRRRDSETIGGESATHISYISGRSKGGFWLTMEKSKFGPRFLYRFLASSMQTFLTPLTARYFEFTLMENAIALVVLGLVGLAPRLVQRQLGGGGLTAQRVVLVMGCLVAGFAHAWFLLICPAFLVPGLGTLPSFVAGLLGVSLSCGLLFAACNAQHDAEAAWEDSASNNHPVIPSRELAWPGFTDALGLVLGPLWAGATLGTPRILFGGQLVLILVISMLSALV